MHQPITLKAYDLLKYLIPVLNRLPKSQKFTFGDRIQVLLMEVLEKLLEAQFKKKDEKRPILEAVNLLLEKLRWLYRLGFDLGYFSSKQYHDFIQRLDEIGRMNGGWLRSL